MLWKRLTGVIHLHLPVFVITSHWNEILCEKRTSLIKVLNNNLFWEIPQMLKLHLSTLDKCLQDLSQLQAEANIRWWDTRVPSSGPVESFKEQNAGYNHIPYVRLRDMATLLTLCSAFCSRQCWACLRWHQWVQLSKPTTKTTQWYNAMQYSSLRRLQNSRK